MHFIASFCQFHCILLPTELIHLTEYFHAVICDFLSVLYADFFRLYPATSFVDDIRSHDSPLTNLMTIVDFAIHVHTVGINVQMEYATFGIPMQGNDVL